MFRNMKEKPMDGSRFDGLARGLTTGSRRGLLFSVMAAIGVAATPISDAAAQKKLVRNQFGCVEVGGKCRGNDGNCCSGVCQGKKPKKGRKDKSACVAHDVGTCQAGQDTCIGGAITCGNNAICVQTTGKAEFCGNVVNSDCRPCRKDADCGKEFGAGAACVLCMGTCPDTEARHCMGAA